MHYFTKGLKVNFFYNLFSREKHFHRQGEIGVMKIEDQDELEIPIYFDEGAYLGNSASSLISILEDDVEINYQEEEEKIPPLLQDNYVPPKAAKRMLKDIKEDPEEYQYMDGSSSINSTYLKRFLSNEEFKATSDLTKFSKEGEYMSSLDSAQRNPAIIRSSKIEKKGIFFFNERVLTLTSTPKLMYLSKNVEKEIDLNPTTSIRQVAPTKFEITNYYPTTKYLFRAKNGKE